MEEGRKWKQDIIEDSGGGEREEGRGRKRLWEGKSQEKEEGGKDNEN